MKSVFAARLAAVFVVFALAGGCTTHRPAEPPTEPTPPVVIQPSLVIAETESALATGLSQRKFNFSSVRDLWLRVRVPTLPRMSTLTIKLTGPSGALVYEDNAPVSTDPAMQMAHMPMTNMMSPVITARTAAGGGFTIDRPLPVAGGVMTRHPDPGVWLASVFSDGFSGTLSSELEIVFER